MSRQPRMRAPDRQPPVLSGDCATDIERAQVWEQSHHDWQHGQDEAAAWREYARRAAADEEVVVA